MNNKIVVSIIIVLLFAALVFSVFLILKWSRSIRDSADGTKSIPEIVLTGKDTVKITLEENPTTGYAWHNSIKNDTVVQVISDEYIPFNKKGIVGSGGVHTWLLKAKSEGTTLITFNYYRNWEGIEKSVKTKIYAINVDEDGKISVK